MSSACSASRELGLCGTAFCGFEPCTNTAVQIYSFSFSTQSERLMYSVYAHNTHAYSVVDAVPAPLRTRSSLLLQFVKAGFAADNLPRFVFPSIVGRPMLRAEEDIIGDIELKVRSTAAP